MSLLESRESNCPYCGEVVELVIDISVPFQEYIEDCPVCCRPMVVVSEVDDHGTARVHLHGEDEV